MVKKAKVKVAQEKWSMQMSCRVTIVRTGHYPTTVIVRLPDGKEVETDMEYLAELNT